MSVQYNRRRDDVRAKFAHPIDELWYRCDGINAVISTCYHLRPALFRGETNEALAVGELVPPIWRANGGACVPCYRVWTGTQFVVSPADEILCRALQRSSQPMMLPTGNAGWSGMAKRRADKKPAAKKSSAKRKRAPAKSAGIRFGYNDERRRFLGGSQNVRMQ